MITPNAGYNAYTRPYSYAMPMYQPFTADTPSAPTVPGKTYDEKSMRTNCYWSAAGGAAVMWLLTALFDAK